MKEKYTLSQIDEERIHAYRKCLAKGFGYGDYNEWPIKLNAAFHLFLTDWGKEFIKDYTELQDKGYSLEAIAPLFYNPSRFYRIVDSLIYGLRRNNIKLVEQKIYVLELLDMAKHLKYGSEFNENGRNEIYSPAFIEENVRHKLRIATQKDSEIIHKFCGIMWAYAECLYFRAHDIPKEIHGPYSFDNERQLIIQEYLNLRPVDIWSNITLLPYQTIKIFKSYSKNVKLQVDPLNHLYHEGDLIPNMHLFYIEIDGIEQSTEKLVELMNIIEKTVFEVHLQLTEMTWNEKVMKYAEIFWYRKKPLCDALIKNWRVPAHVEKNIQVGSENLNRKSRLTDEESSILAMLTI